MRAGTSTSSGAARAERKDSDAVSCLREHAEDRVDGDEPSRHQPGPAAPDLSADRRVTRRCSGDRAERHDIGTASQQPPAQSPEKHRRASGVRSCREPARRDPRARRVHGVPECRGKHRDQSGRVVDGKLEGRSAPLALPEADDDDPSVFVPGHFHLSTVAARVDEGSTVPCPQWEHHVTMMPRR
jgi:hypothetical protein